MSSLWIDTDMGFDDMLAIMIVTQAAPRADLAIAGCSLVFGNAPLEKVQSNAANMADTFNWRFPIHSGAAAALCGDVITATNVLGEQGIPTLSRRLSESAPLPIRSSALDGLVSWLEGNDENRQLLALGPLTNIARLCHARPDLLVKIERITWMGGGAGRGNHTAFAEFNAFADPEALAVVCDAGIPFRMVDLDCCRQVTVTPLDLDELRQSDGPNAALLHDLFGGYIDIGISRGRPSMALYDPVAAACVADEQTVTFSSVAINVDCTQNPTRGQTNIDHLSEGAASSAIQIGVSAHAGKIRAMALRALMKASQ